MCASAHTRTHARATPPLPPRCAQVRVIPPNYVFADVLTTTAATAGAAVAAKASALAASVPKGAQGVFIKNFAVEGQHNFTRYGVLGQGYNVFEGGLRGLTGRGVSGVRSPVGDSGH